MVNDIVTSVAQFPWASLISGGTGILGALLGACLANSFAEKRWAKQIVYEKEKDRIKFIREKGEELHLLLSRWGKSLFLYQLNQLSVVHGKLSEEQFHKLAKDITLEPGTHDRLETLLFLYFSELEPLMIKTREYISEGNKAYELAIKEELNINEASKRLNFASNETEVGLERIKAGIRQIIKNLE
ncbi:hypothetical protein M2R49_08990 [Citrobacter amalonaticus]|uniref:hypothetical protein n=1 Tax=Citrobacter amalonaticus TaxID=35703 RepID=UPI0021E4A697|nr:hypothetical protein [Citrobacter amalonaticus]UYF57272.1 hypothetical protein M2R49_08990 [Citrobacter amalonaticus]